MNVFQAKVRRLPRPDESSLRTMRTLGKDPLAAPGAYFDQLGETFELSVLGTRFVFTRDPEWFDEVLVKKAKSFENDRTTKNLGALLGQGLLVLDGVAWRERRRLLSPPFLPAAVEGRLGLFAAETRRELARWRAGTVIDLHAAMARLTMRIALGALFGYDAKDDEHFETQMAAAMRYFEGIAGTQIPLPTWIPTATNRAFVRARAEQRALADRLLERRAEEGTALAALQAGLDSGHVTRQDVLDEVMTLLVAGHETSALSLTYLLAELGAGQRAARTDRPRSPRVRSASDARRCHAAGCGSANSAGRMAPLSCRLGGWPRDHRGRQRRVHVLARGTQVYLFQ